MGSIKVKNNNKWVTIASSDSTGIQTTNPKLTEDNGLGKSIDKVLENHEDRVSKLERNVSWLAEHGGGGSGSGGGGTTITEATTKILVNDTASGGSVIIDQNGLKITLSEISVQATKTWTITVRIGSVQVAVSSASYINNTVIIPFKTISDNLTNHTGNLYINASYEDEINGIYGNSSWNGTITESVVNIQTNNVSVGLTEEGELESAASFIYTYSVGIVGDYTLNITVTKDGKDISEKSYPITIINTSTATFSVLVTDLLDEIEVGVYNVTTQLVYNDNKLVQNTIVNNLTIVSKTILISTTTLSEDQEKPVEVNLSGSINLVWTAYLQSASTFQYTYKIGDVVVKDSSIGYFGVGINDYISVIGKDWAVEGQTVALTVTVTSGSEKAEKTWYFKFVQSLDSFLEQTDTVKSHELSNFLSREFNAGDQTFELSNDSYLIGGSKTKVTSKLDLYNKSNLVGIKTNSTNAPYLRISNGAYATLGEFKVGDNSRTFSDIIQSNNGDFTISIAFKADYHPDDDRTILFCGNADSETGDIITGIEIDVHDVYVNTSSQLRLTDNTINNLDIVCIHSDDDYIDSEGQLQKQRHYIIKIFLEGALSAVLNTNSFPTLGDSIFIGGKTYGENEGWLCDCNIYNLQVYDYAFSDYEILINYVNNKISETYKDSNFDFSIIDEELRKNFCERDAEGNVTSYIYQNGSYTVDFLLDGTKLSEDKLNQYAKAVGIPVMLIDVSTDDSWTFNNFVTQQTADNVQLPDTSGKTLMYWDPTQQNTSVLTVNDVTIGLQGTSTLADAVKNINITVPDSTVFIPKSTWLPEQTYTLKADVVDSSHSNNASIGKFINTVLKDYFPSDPTAKENVENSDYVLNQQPTATLKHTVEGFPILLIMNFHTTETSLVSTTPLGIYSFNLGRDAFRNLGFRKVNKITDNVGSNIEVTTFPFLSENCTYNETDSNANWVEIKDTTSLADFSKLTGNSLPDGFDSSVGDFWQNDDTILNQRYEVRYPAGRQVSDYPSFKNFVGIVMSLPIEGLYNTADRIGTVNRPVITTEYDLYTYNNGYIKTGKKQQIITDVNQLPELGFNATSIYKYFVIANFFGLADNFGKNATFRSWNNGDYYIGFYDMDTALGGGNQGSLSIDPDMWLKYLKNEILEDKKYGFVAETFNSEDPNRLSNTTISANHNKLWLVMDTPLFRSKANITEISGTSAYSYYWDDFRETIYNFAVKAGYSNAVDYFVNEFYLKQTGDCGPLLFNLDYKLKYLVQFTDDSYSNTKYLSKLHGRKAAYTLDWLNRHVLFLDSIFYWRNTSQKFSYPNDLNSKMSSTVYNTPEFMPIKSNTSLIVYHNVGNATQTYYFLPKNKVVYVDAGNNTSDSEVTWGITNSPQIIEIGDEDNPLSNMNVYVISSTNTDLHINNPGLTAITELNLKDSNSLASPFSLSSFEPYNGVSEIRTLNFANTQSRLIQGNRPTFTLELTTQLSSGETDTKYTKLREIDISNSQCVSDITIPSIPLSVLNVYNSALTNLNLDNQNYIDDIDLTGCTKLITISIKECELFKQLNVSNLNNLQEVIITNNPSISSINISGCNNLKKVTIQNNSNLTSIRISNCTGLTGASSSSNYLTITDNKKLTSLSLDGCINLQTFTISTSNQENITTLNLYNTSTTYIQGDGVDTSLLDLQKFKNLQIFNIYGDTKVVEIQFLNEKDNPVILNTNFQSCNSLKRIYGNLILKQTTGTQGSGMFRGCSNFTIHGNEDKTALGPTNWRSKQIRDTNNRVKTIWEIFSGSKDNKPSDPESDPTRPYSKVTWDNTYATGSKITNIKIGSNSINYMFYGTNLTQFDVYYMLFIFSQISGNISLDRPFYNLKRNEGEYILFNWKDTDNLFNRFTFYKLSNVTGINECFGCSSTPSINTSSSTYILSPEDDYNIDNDEDNGVFSPLVNVTGIGRLTNTTLNFSKTVFTRYDGKNYKINSFSYQDMGNIYVDDTYSVYSTASSSQNIPSIKGDFTNFFANLPNLTSITSFFNFQYINYSTLQFPTSINSIKGAFKASSGGTGTIDIKKMFTGCKNLTNISNFATTSTNTGYGSQADFPITSDMFSEFTNLKKVGYDTSDTTSGGNSSTFSFKGARHYINQSTFPEDILVNNPKIEAFTHVFYQCENKEFSSTPKIPGNMFINTPNLINVNGLFWDANFPMTLSSNGFAKCKNIQIVANFVRHSATRDNNSRSKLTGEIPYKFFYHGSSNGTTTVYGSDQEDKPGEDFDLESDLKSTQVTYTTPSTGISDMSYCFAGCLNLNYYSNIEDQDFVENNPNYSPYKWNYNKTTKVWTENNNKKEKIAYWGYTGDPSTQNPDYEYLEDDNIELIRENNISGKSEYLNYCCSPDLLRYSNPNCNIEGLFDYCGLDIQNVGIINTSEDYQDAGLNGRICPYLLKPTPNVSNINYLFRYCRRLSGYIKDGVTYLIPSDFFTYATNITNLLSAFQGMDFPYNVQLGVFNSLKGSLDIRKIFCLCRYTQNETTNAPGTISNVFQNNTIAYLTGVFSTNDINLSGNYFGSEKEYWTLGQTGKVKFNNNFNINKIPNQTNITFVYNGFTTSEAVDSAIPNTNSNYE